MAMSENVIELGDVRVGDTVRVLQRDQDVEIATTLRVAGVNKGSGWTDLTSPLGGEVTVFTTRDNVVIHLVSRPETSPEVEAIATALGVSYDVASDYHSKGMRHVDQ